jgi:hypothetical protein
LLRTPILFTPFVENGQRGIRFQGRIGLDAILGGKMLVTKVASPSGLGLNYQQVFRGEWRRAA